MSSARRCARGARHDRGAPDPHGGRPADLAEPAADVRLVLTSTDLDGVTTTDDDRGLQDRLGPRGDARVPGARPACRAAGRSCVAKVQGGQPRQPRDRDLPSQATFPVNGQLEDRAGRRPLPQPHRRRLRGRAARPHRRGARAGAISTSQFRRTGFKDTRETSRSRPTQRAGSSSVRSTGSAAITRRGPGRPQPVVELPEAAPEPAGVVHAVAGDAGARALRRARSSGPRSPCSACRDRRATPPITSASWQLEDGFLVRQGLPAGDYRLLPEGSHQAMTIRVAAGETVGRTRLQRGPHPGARRARRRPTSSSRRPARRRSRSTSPMPTS